MRVAIVFHAGDEPLGRYEVELQYDTRRLELLAVEGGEAEFSAEPAWSDDSGQLRLSATNTASSASPTGQVALAELVFRAADGGTAALDWLTHELLGTDQSPYEQTVLYSLQIRIAEQLAAVAGAVAAAGSVLALFLFRLRRLDCGLTGRAR